jgi:hypothetical protein
VRSCNFCSSDSIVHNIKKGIDAVLLQEFSEISFCFNCGRSLKPKERSKRKSNITILRFSISEPENVTLVSAPDMTFHSISEAAKASGIHPVTLHTALITKKKTDYRGFKWEVRYDG